MSENVSITADNRALFKAALKQQVENGLDMIGAEVEARAKAKCPVGTSQSTGKPNYKGGTLRNSITHQKSGDMEVQVGTNVEYGKYVEVGTSKMRAQPYLKPAATDNTGVLKSLMDSALRG